MKDFRAFAASAILVLAGIYFLWPHIDRTASRIALCATGFGLILAWYSILDLQRQRKERFWPHTVDRLMRATFTAITLVFVVNIAFPKPEPVDVIVESTKPPPVAPEAIKVRFRDDIISLEQKDAWNEVGLKDVVDAHFNKLSGTGSLRITYGDQGFVLFADAGEVRVRPQ